MMNENLFESIDGFIHGGDYTIGEEKDESMEMKEKSNWLSVY